METRWEDILDESLVRSEYFRMFEFKTQRCPWARPHDWTQCPFAHPTEKAKRRNPTRYKYNGTACADFRKNGVCRRGDACPFAHGVFEAWLHPARYRTKMCTDGQGCSRHVCFFAHSEDEFRQPTPEVLQEVQELKDRLFAELQGNELFAAQLDNLYSILAAAAEEQKLRAAQQRQQSGSLQMLQELQLAHCLGLLGSSPSPMLGSLTPAAVAQQLLLPQLLLDQLLPFGCLPGSQTSLAGLQHLASGSLLQAPSSGTDLAALHPCGSLSSAATAAPEPCSLAPGQEGDFRMMTAAWEAAPTSDAALGSQAHPEMSQPLLDPGQHPLGRGASLAGAVLPSQAACASESSSNGSGTQPLAEAASQIGGGRRGGGGPPCGCGPAAFEALENKQCNSSKGGEQQINIDAVSQDLLDKLLIGVEGHEQLPGKASMPPLGNGFADGYEAPQLRELDSTPTSWETTADELDIDEMLAEMPRDISELHWPARAWAKG